MTQDYLKYLNSPLKTKVEQLLNQSSSLSNDEKSIVIELLNFFTTKINKLQDDYSQLLNKNDINIKKRPFNMSNDMALDQGTGNEGSDQMLIDSNEPMALPTNQYFNFTSRTQDQKPKFSPSLYTIKNIIHDVSFMNPRRTYNVVITNEAFIIIYPKGNFIELVIPFSSILEIICVTVPETTTKQWCFSLVVDLDYRSQNKSSLTSSNHEIFIFKFNDNKSLKVYEPPSSSGETSQLDEFGFQPVSNSSSCNKDYLVKLLKTYLWPNSNKTVLEPNTATFVSKKKSMSSHSKNKTHRFHIDCYYKAKEGYLFLLNEGIFYGAKKPSFYFPMNAIISIQVTNVMARTFNLNIRRRQQISSSTSSSSQPNKKLKSDSNANTNSNSEEENFEFSMIDAVEFEGIMEYIRQHKTEWSTNRNGEFGMNTEETGQNQNSKDGTDNGDDDDDDDTNEGKGEAQNIFTFVDEDESNDEDYHPDQDSDEGESSDSDSDSDTVDKEQEKLDIEKDKKLLKAMNKGEIEDDDEDDEEGDEIEKEQESEIENKTKTKKTKTIKSSKSRTANSTTTSKKAAPKSTSVRKKKTESKKKEKSETSTAASTPSISEDIVMKDSDEATSKEEDEDINEISSNVEEIDLSKSPSKPSKRKSSNPKKVTTTKKRTSTKSTTKSNKTNTKTNSNSNSTSTTTNTSINKTQDTKKITSPTASKSKGQTKQLTMYDLFSKKASSSSSSNNKNNIKKEEPISIEDDEDKVSSSQASANEVTESTTNIHSNLMNIEDDDDDDEEDEILFE